MGTIKKTIKRLITGSTYTIEGLFRKVPNLRDKKLLDLGCGPAYYSIVFYSILEEEMSKTSKEINDQIRMIDKEDRDFWPRNELPDAFIQGDVRNLPYEDKKFEIVATGRLLNNFKTDVDVDKTLNEVARVLKSKGYFIGDVPLHSSRKGIEKFRLLTDFLNFLIVEPIESRRYENAIRKAGFEFLVKDTGIYDGQFKYHRGDLPKELYFVAQKIT